jgi:DNA invertase Pin-like site-specific DNA recombinase
MADKQTSPKEFLELLKTLYPVQDLRDIDVTTLRYVIYARKSTKGEERQERSIPDQIDDCMKREVIPNGLHVVGKPIREKGSAKEPDVRPLFRDMLDDIKAGKIDGIITWHTDRLARNMKEAGEIIDLLDKGILKDLRFATSTFENSPTGKMLLGISFVLSKQYSEHLSESVTRGNTKKTEAGIFFDEMKHGYYVSNDGKLFPDGNNFILIKQAFEKRLEGWGQLEIARWLNTQGYTVRKKNKRPQSYKWDKDNVSKLLRDTVYTGVLRYGKAFVDLTEFYDFEPVISVDDFLKVNKVKDLADPKLVSSIMVKSRETTKADLLRGIVYCGHCNKALTSGITPKQLKNEVRHYYYYRCETDGCTYKNRSIRAKVVLDDAINCLSEHLFTTENNYDHYVTEAQEYAAVRAHALDGDIAALSKQVGNKQIEYDRTLATIRDNPELARHYNPDEARSELKGIQKDLDKLVSMRKQLKQSVLTYSQYLELFKNTGVILAETHDMAILDETIRKFFLNFTIKATQKDGKQRYEVSHKLKNPWNEFIETGNFDRGRADRTRTRSCSQA